MPDVSSSAPADVRLWVSLDVHKLSIVAARWPPEGGDPELERIESTEKAIRRFVERLGGARGWGGARAWQCAARRVRAASMCTGC